MPSFDPHAQVIVDTWATLVELMGALAAADDPVAAIDAAVDDAVAEFVRKVRRFNVFRLIEVARMAFLPMCFDDDWLPRPRRVRRTLSFWRSLPSRLNVRLPSLARLILSLYRMKK
ncbi:hypothetical protein KDL01_18075 [Actinospica durhamensis]|uniref:Uncharacterized protein n=1 Tax=Actinospica durhamensis TaxID=1508375 RepID=A0A941EPV5_9ACTN|nr:hypothetical protein [Actinospica durhamensis]MBR7835186.1 hypothetical protein [Actinospica durhamensis]